MESSLRAESSHLRITARLIRVRDQVQIWSDSFDRNMSSILSLQQDISAAIAEQVRTRLSPDRQRALARRQTQNAEAYDLFLRGRHFLDQRTPEAMQRAIEFFQRATVADPTYSAAWANLAMAYGSSPMNSDVDPRRVSPPTREAALRAVAANPDVAEAQHALGHARGVGRSRSRLEGLGDRRQTLRPEQQADIANRIHPRAIRAHGRSA
jgi:hypothetical protein